MDIVENTKKIDTIAILWLVNFLGGGFSQFMVLLFITDRISFDAYFQIVPLLTLLWFFILIVELVLALRIGSSNYSNQFRTGIIVKNIGVTILFLSSQFLYSQLLVGDPGDVDIINLGNQINTVILLSNYLIFLYIAVGILDMTRTSSKTIIEEYPTVN